MHSLVLVLIALHALAGVFWGRSTLALTHTSPTHRITPELFRAQMSAAALAAQVAMRSSPVMSQRIAAVLLSVTVVCMVISPQLT